MDLTAANVSAYQQAQYMGQAQTTVAAKVLDIARQQGDAALQLVQAAADIGKQGGDSLVGAATGLGGQLDTFA